MLSGTITIFSALLLFQLSPHLLLVFYIIFLVVAARLENARPHASSIIDYTWYIALLNNATQKMTKWPARINAYIIAAMRLIVAIGRRQILEVLIYR